jgi:hypothetical protein
VYIERNVLRTDTDADDATSEDSVDVNRPTVATVYLRVIRLPWPHVTGFMTMMMRPLLCLILTLRSMQSSWLL